MSKKTVLAIKTHALGDVLLVTPALHRLRLATPGKRLVCLTTSRCAPLFAGNPDIDELIVLQGLRPTPALLVQTSRLISLRPDEAVVFQVSPLARALARLSGTRRIAHLRSDTSAGSENTISWPPERDRYTGDAYQDLVAALFPESERASRAPRVFVQEKELYAADELLRGKGLDGTGRFAVIAPGGGHNQRQDVPEKRWPTDRFAELIDRVQDTLGLPVVLVGSPEERGIIHQVTSACTSAPRNLAGETDLRLLSAVVKKSSMVITNDSLVLHLGVALARRVIGLFGPTSAANFLPAGTGVHRAVSSNVPCSPCYGNGLFPGCALGRATCMAGITVDHVFDAVKGAWGLET